MTTNDTCHTFQSMPPGEERAQVGREIIEPRREKSKEGGGADSWVSHVRHTKYSLQVSKKSYFGQRHGLHSITFTTYFYKNIY